MFDTGVSVNVRVDVLGPFRLIIDGVEVAVSRPQVRTVMAYLASVQDSVSTGVLVEALWPNAIPADPAAALRTVLSRTRSALGVYSDRLEGTGDSYFLAVDSDWAEMSRLRERAKGGRRAEDLPVLEQAHQLWRGEPFSGAIDSPEMDTRRAVAGQSLASVRRTLLGAYAIAERYTEAVELGVEVLKDTPEDEHIACVVARSLALSGRKTQGIKVLEQTRLELRERGLDVSPALAQTESEILQGATDLALEERHAGSPPGSGHFVGREAELAKLVHLPPKSTVLVEGETGIGKTSLLGRYQAVLADQGVPVVTATASASAGAPMQVFRELASAFIDMDADLAEEQRGPLSMLLPERVKGDNRPSTRESLVAGTVNFIAARAESVDAVVIVEDAQWLDTASSLALRQLIESDRCRIVLTSRPGHTERILGNARDRVQIVSLGPLSPSECDSVVLSALPTASSDQTARYHERSGGNPFFLHMLIDLAQQELEVDDALPPVVLVAVQQRLEALSRDARQVLQAASVVGLEFSASVLDELDHRAEAGLREAKGAGLVHETGEVGVVTFRHAIVADAAYQLLGEGDRVALHDQVGRVLEAFGEEPMTVWPHCRQASSLDAWRAIEFAGRSANQHLDAYDWDGALEAASWGLDYHASFDADDFGSPHKLVVAKARAQLALGIPNSHLLLIDGACRARKHGDDDTLITSVIELCNSGSVALTGIEMAPVKELIEAALASNVEDSRLLEVKAAAARAFVYSEHGEYGQRLYAEAFAKFDQCDRRVQELILRNSEAGLSNPADFDLAQSATTRLSKAADLNPELRWLARWFQFRDALINADGDRLAWGLRDLWALSTGAERRHAFVVLGQTFDMDMQRSWAAATMSLIHEDFDLAEACANQALETGMKQLAIRDDGFGEGWVTASYGLLLLAIRHGQGRLAELVEVVETDAPLVPAWNVAIVITNFAAGNMDRARAELEPLVANNFAALVPDPTWTAATFLLAEPVIELMDLTVVEQLYRLVEPYSDRMSYSGLCTFGPMSQALATLADALGWPDVASRHRSDAGQMTQNLRERSQWGFDELRNNHKP